MKKKYIIGGIVLILVAAYLIFLSFNNSISYYLTVSELLEDRDSYYDTNLRVAGRVAEAAIDWDAAAMDLTFEIVEGGANLPVVYHGTKPDGFQPGADILAEGKYLPDSIFYAESLIMQCPSKYEIEE